MNTPPIRRLDTSAVAQLFVTLHVEPISSSYLTRDCDESGHLGSCCALGVEYLSEKFLLEDRAGELPALFADADELHQLVNNCTDWAEERFGYHYRHGIDSGFTIGSREVNGNSELTSEELREIINERCVASPEFTEEQEERYFLGFGDALRIWQHIEAARRMRERVMVVQPTTPKDVP